MGKQSLTWTTIRVPLGNLKEWDKNPAHISEKDARQLAKSLDRFDHVLPYVAAAPKNGSKELPLLDGHQRKMVELSLRKIDPKTLVDVRVPSRKLTEKEQAELSVRLRRNVGEWDSDALLNWFESGDLLEWGFEQTELESFGFEFGEEGADAEPQIDRAAELLKKWKVREGDLWQIGEHRLICGDCTDAAVVARVMEGERAKAVLTDPPYQMGKDMENDSLDNESFVELHNGFMKALPLDKKATIICFHSPRTFPTALDAGRNAGLKFERMLYMTKPNDITFPWRGWLLTSEAILVFSVGGGSWVDVHPYTADTYLHNHHGGEINDGGDKEARAPLYHPSIKPMEVVTDLLSRIGGDVVYDPFGGSGTTMVACNNLGRKCRMIEIDPSYCAVILQRMSDLGLSPFLIKEPTSKNVSANVARTAKSNKVAERVGIVGIRE